MTWKPGDLVFCDNLDKPTIIFKTDFPWNIDEIDSLEHGEIGIVINTTLVDAQELATGAKGPPGDVETWVWLLTPRLTYGCAESRRLSSLAELEEVIDARRSRTTSRSR